MDYRRLRRRAEQATKEGRREEFLLEEIGCAYVDAWGTTIPTRAPKGTAMADPEYRNNLSLRKLFEAVVPNGLEVISNLDDPNFNLTRLSEAGEVNTGMFANITGQLVFNTILQSYEQEDFAFTRAIPSVTTRFIRGEKIPGISFPSDQNQIIPEGHGYPSVGLTEEWIQTPVTVKRGSRIDVTKETLISDLTGELLTKAGAIGLSLGQNQENRACDCVVDEGTTTHRYRRNDAAALATYDDNTGGHTWDNLQASNALVDWTDLEAADLLLSAILDPSTNEPVMIQSTMLVCTKQLENTALRIRNATETTVATPGYATTDNPTVTKMSGGPYAGGFDILTSRRLQLRMTTDTSWFWGDVRNAFRHMQIWPITTVQRPPSADAEFDRDIVWGSKTSVMGAYVVVDPRRMVKSTVA